MFFFIIIRRDRLSKWLRWKRLFWNSWFLTSEYVKNKAALFALQDHSSQTYVQHKGKRSKTRLCENIRKKSTVIQYAEKHSRSPCSSCEWMFFLYKRNKLAEKNKIKSVPSSWHRNRCRCNPQKGKRERGEIHYQRERCTFQSIQWIRTSFNKQDLHA